MRKIIFILAVFLSAAIFSCGDDSDSNITTGYVDPGLGAVKQLIPKKHYSVASYSCSTAAIGNESCGAIIYQGSSSTGYTGIAAGLDSTNPGFSIKVYWPGSLTVNPNTTDTTTYNDATVKVTVNSASSTYSGNITLNITTDTTIANDSSTVTYYKIVFKSTINVGGTYTINIDDTINAYAY